MTIIGKVEITVRPAVGGPTVDKDCQRCDHDTHVRGDNDKDAA